MLIIDDDNSFNTTNNDLKLLCREIYAIQIRCFLTTQTGWEYKFSYTIVSSPHTTPKIKIKVS